MGRWKGAVDHATQWADEKVTWILLRSGPMERYRGSYFPTGLWKGAVDPTTQWDDGKVLWIQLPNVQYKPAHLFASFLFL